jgi:hypothetical protein
VKWDDLAMVNLQSKPDGSWSYTAYKRPFALWRSNKGLPDVFCCIEDIMHEICLADDLEQVAAVHNILAKSTALDESMDASGGISGKPAKVKGKAKR